MKFATLVLAFFVLLTAEQVFGQPLRPEAEGKAEKKKLTPEERAQRKMQKEAEENEIFALRRQSFGTLPPNDTSPLAPAYIESLNVFTKAVADTSNIYRRHQYRKTEDTNVLEKIGMEWVDQMAVVNKALNEWRRQAGIIYASDPDKYVAIGETLREMLVNDCDVDKFDGWLDPAKALVTAGKLDNPDVLLKAGMIGYANNDFDFARECWTKLKSQNLLPAFGEAALAELEQSAIKWQRELEFRKRDEAKDDNPRVEMITTKGRIIMELYEDDAPEAVNNFVYLVEKGYYNRKPMFRVVQHLCAQTGCEKGDGSGSAGYTIAGEVNLPNHRDHFRGSLAVALGTNQLTGRLDPDSGGSQFYFTFMPLPHLDGKHTVFGRVIDGMECVNLFRVMDLSIEEQRKEQSNRPDVVVSAKVIRKRSHDYRPTPVTGKLPR